MDEMNETNVTIYSILRTIRTYNTCVLREDALWFQEKENEKKRIKRSLLYYAIATHLYARFMLHK